LICAKLFLVECPIESCYVGGGFQLNSLAKKAPGGRSLDMIIYSSSLLEGAWEGWLNMDQGYCNRLVEEAKNNYYILYMGGFYIKMY